MDYLTTKRMQQPNHPIGWFEILNLIQNITPWFVVGGLMWRLIDRVVKYFSDGREAEMNKLIDAKQEPLIQAIEKLTDAVNQLKYTPRT